MLFRGRTLAITAANLLMIAGLGTQLPRGKKTNLPEQWTSTKRAVHALNRLTFGPRPDLQRVEQMGVEKWVDLQLHPKESTTPPLNAAGPFPHSAHGHARTGRNFPPNQVIRQVAHGKTICPAIHQACGVRSSGPAIRGRQEEGRRRTRTVDRRSCNRICRYREGMAEDADREGRQGDRRVANLKTKELLALPPDQRLKEILQMLSRGPACPSLWR